MGLVDGLGRLHNERQEGLQILVASAVADGGHALHSGLLDLLLDVASQLGDRHGQGHQDMADGRGHLLSHGLQDLEGADLVGGLGLYAQAGLDGRHAGLNGVGAHGVDDGLSGDQGSVLHGLGLVAAGLQDGAQGSDQEGLGLGALGGKGGEALQSLRAIVLVGDLGHEALDLGLHGSGHGCRERKVSADETGTQNYWKHSS
mmetsp:Transcript_70157/g.146773  ORF Transcript_70157/g.146773 Transcript_70157/m.146773 type:complete len:202 (-) Transcript_70157:7-612(-)